MALHNRPAAQLPLCTSTQPHDVQTQLSTCSIFSFICAWPSAVLQARTEVPARKPRPRPANPTNISKRKHRPNPQRQQQRFTRAQRFAMVMAVIAVTVMGPHRAEAQPAPLSVMGVVTGEQAAVNVGYDTVKAAHKLLCDTVLVEGVGLAGTWLSSKNATRSIRYWYGNLLKFGTIRSRYKHESHAKKHAIPDEVLHECIRQIMLHHYKSKHDAHYNNSYIWSVCQQYDCDIIYLWRYMHMADSRLAKCIHLQPRMKLSKELKEARVQYCREMSQRSDLDNFIWVDQKKLYVSPKELKAWGLRGVKHDDVKVTDEDLEEGADLRVGDYVYDIELMDHCPKTVCLYLYVAVNAKLGAICLVKCTGTICPGEPKNTKYKVCVCCYMCLITGSCLYDLLYITKHDTLGSRAHRNALVMHGAHTPREWSA